MTDDKNARRVQKRASLHEKAVQAVASGRVASGTTRTRKSAQTRSHPVDLGVNVAKLPAWAKDIVLAEITSPSSYTRWEIRDDKTVIIR